MQSKNIRQMILFCDSVFLSGDGLLPFQHGLLKKRLSSGGAVIIVLPGLAHLTDLFVLRQLSHSDNGFL